MACLCNIYFFATRLVWPNSGDPIKIFIEMGKCSHLVTVRRPLGGVAGLPIFNLAFVLVLASVLAACTKSGSNVAYAAALPLSRRLLANRFRFQTSAAIRLSIRVSSRYSSNYDLDSSLSHDFGA